MRAAVVKKYIHIVSGASFIAAVVLLFWRRNHWLTFGLYIPTVKPSDVLIAFSLLGMVIWCIWNWKSDELRLKRQVFLYWLKYPAILVAFLFISSLWSLFVFHQGSFISNVMNHGRIGLGVAAFFLTIFFGFQNERYVRWITYSFLSSLVITPLLFASEGTILGNFLVASPVAYSFLGFEPGPAVLGNLLIVPIVILFSLYLVRGGWSRYLYWAGTALLVAFLWWTTSRAAWAGGLVGMVVAAGVHIRQHAAGRPMAKHAVRALISVFMIYVVGLGILSPLARNTVILRVFPHLKLYPIVAGQVATGQGMITRLRLPTLSFWEVNERVIDIGFDADRGVLWKQYLFYFFGNPIGFGPAYASIVHALNGSGVYANAHSTWLQVALSGGVGALITFIFFLYQIGRRMMKFVRYRRDAIAIGVAGSFVGLLVAMSFFDGLDFRWWWIIMGLAVVLYENTRAHDEKT